MELSDGTEILDILGWNYRLRINFLGTLDEENYRCFELVADNLELSIF
jgi:hypothetical protein